MTIDALPNEDENVRWESMTSSSLDTLFRTFSEPIRRQAVVLLSREDEPISVSELADRLDGDTDRMRTALLHVHLPMLDSAGVVDWYPMRESVTFGGVPSRYDDLFEVVRRDVEG